MVEGGIVLGHQVSKSALEVDKAKIVAIELSPTTECKRGQEFP